jgi:hypothetical protein
MKLYLSFLSSSKKTLKRYFWDIGMRIQGYPKQNLLVLKTQRFGIKVLEVIKVSFHSRKSMTLY